MLPSKTVRKAIRVLEFARRNHVSVDFDEAQDFIRARKALAANPGDAEAQRGMRHFEVLFYYAGRDPELSVNSPECPQGCPECGERRRRREAT